jgi:hypothetical protein
MEPNTQPTIQPTNTPESSTGPAIAIVIVLAMIILGGFYFWSERNKTINEPLGATPEEMISLIETQSTSDESGAIEADLSNTDLDNLDKELQAI